MASERAQFLSRPETVMRSHLTADELREYLADTGTVQWTAPSKIAFLTRHAILSVTLLTGVVVAAILLATGASDSRIPQLLTGAVLVVIAFALATLEIRLFFRTYTRYVITPSRILRMEGIVYRNSSAIEWDKISDISDTAGILAQTFDYGDISVETANENSKFRVLYDVPKPRRFLEAMNDARKRRAKTPLNEAALKAMVSLERLLSEGGLVVERTGDEVSPGGWRVRREAPGSPPASG